MKRTLTIGIALAAIACGAMHGCTRSPPQRRWRVTSGLLTAQLQRLVNQLSPADRQHIRILMVSFDAAHDTPEALTAFKSEHHIQGASWLVAHASASDVRALAAALGIQYRELADHTFNHSAIISIADRDGIVHSQTNELTATDDAFVRIVHNQIADVPKDHER